MMIGQLQQAVRVINTGNYIAAGVYGNGAKPTAKGEIAGKGVKMKSFTLILTATFDFHDDEFNDIGFKWSSIDGKAVIRCAKRTGFYNL